MSGTKYSQGDLGAKGISIITKAISSNPDYDLKAIENLWRMWEAYLNLEGPAKASSSANTDNLYFPDEMKEIIRNLTFK